MDPSPLSLPCIFLPSLNIKTYRQIRETFAPSSDTPPQAAHIFLFFNRDFPPISTRFSESHFLRQRVAFFIRRPSVTMALIPGRIVSALIPPPFALRRIVSERNLAPSALRVLCAGPPSPFGPPPPSPPVDIRFPADPENVLKVPISSIFSPRGLF